MPTTLSITPTRVIFGGGKFDSENRYLRAGNPSASLPITQGVTFQITRSGADSSAWRYSVAGYVVNFGGLTADSAFTLVTT